MEITLAELASLIRGGSQNETPTKRSLGQNIVVLDRGFVYVGEVIEEPDRIHIKDAKNIRFWGTKNGLGELRNGPLAETKLDVVGDVTAYRHAIIHIIACKGF